MELHLSYRLDRRHPDVADSVGRNTVDCRLVELASAIAQDLVLRSVDMVCERESVCGAGGTART
eukprot:3488257-Prymnesium_polylepis.1